MRTLYIEPGSPWENGYVESFNGKLRDELPERGELRDPERGPGAGGEVEAGVQPATASQCLGLPATRTRGQIPKNPSPGAGSPEWTAKGPVSNVARGLVSGGRSRARGQAARTPLPRRATKATTWSGSWCGSCSACSPTTPASSSRATSSWTCLRTAPPKMDPIPGRGWPNCSRFSTPRKRSAKRHSTRTSPGSPT